MRRHSQAETQLWTQEGAEVYNRGWTSTVHCSHLSNCSRHGARSHFILRVSIGAIKPLRSLRSAYGYLFNGLPDVPTFSTAYLSISLFIGLHNSQGAWSAVPPFIITCHIYMARESKISSQTDITHVIPDFWNSFTTISFDPWRFRLIIYETVTSVSRT